MTIDARIVVASVDTYLRFADAVNRLNISEQDPKAGLPEVVGDVVGGVSNKAVKGVAKHKTDDALDSAGEKLANAGQKLLTNLLTGDQPERQKSPQRRSRRSTS